MKIIRSLFFGNGTEKGVQCENFWNCIKSSELLRLLLLIVQIIHLHSNALFFSGYIFLIVLFGVSKTRFWCFFVFFYYLFQLVLNRKKKKIVDFFFLLLWLYLFGVKITCKKKKKLIYWLVEYLYLDFKLV